MLIFLLLLSLLEDLIASFNLKSGLFPFLALAFMSWDIIPSSCAMPVCFSTIGSAKSFVYIFNQWVATLNLQSGLLPFLALVIMSWDIIACSCNAIQQITFFRSTSFQHLKSNSEVKSVARSLLQFSRKKKTLL